MLRFMLATSVLTAGVWGNFVFADMPAAASQDTARQSRLLTATETLPAKVRLVSDGRHHNDVRWRYRHHNGHWWYWLPSNRWAIWTGNDWVNYDRNTYYPRYGYRGYGNRYNTGYRGYYGPGYYGQGYYGGYGYGNRGAAQGAAIGAGIGGAVGGPQGAGVGAAIGSAIGNDRR